MMRAHHHLFLMRARTKKDYKEDLEYLKNVYNSEITTTDKILRRWEKTTA